MEKNTTNVLQTYQTILFHNEDSLKELIHNEVLAILEKRKLVQVEENIETNKIYTSSQAAAFLKIKPQSLIRARGKGRIKGKLIDGREYGYEYEELKKYVRGAHKKVTA